MRRKREEWEKEGKKERHEKETDGVKKVDGGVGGGGRRRFQLDSTCHAEDLFSTVYYVPPE